ncbi:MAG: ribonuclease HII [Clostridia bacterium]|nr:ribonuclease HII [Clostridia bacterium]
MDWLEYEKKAYEKGFVSICGVDEAGRGPLAGPVCAAAVILPKDLIIEGVNDSKKLSEKKREQLFDVIKEQASAYSVGWASVEEIEDINILRAAMLAMKRAVEGLSKKADFAYIDGNKTPDLKIPCEAVVKGDAKVMSIAAASILAKVSRDRLMLQYAEEYPQYGFEKHKGYGTKAHIEAVLEYGSCPIHRESFLKKIYEKNREQQQ